ncbi:variant erythrocyte surface antigen-1 family protein [Babesia divergens]|uniref:Variant erythrocyte surface antigen-1 family protein n=1 Tax=Babesia divergens TaxID=32595 RepID=A0AAD9GBZ8_BABDI|nr:variant erythrocyte surface antigen-1 family protein [Babesia divergens]
MVCYMYYTDVFVGTNNDINNLKKALKAELPESGLNGDLESQLTALASGLKSFLDGIKNNGSQYVSSYDKATWKELCEKCKCKLFSNSSCNCSCRSSDVCEPSQCCENCNVKKAAKIFLGFIPCLYYALDYLYKQCNGKGGWSSHKIINKDSSLHRFLRGMGYLKKDLKDDLQASQIPGLLQDLFSSDSKFKKLYDFVSKNYLPSTSIVSPSDSQPKTVRDILLWLSGLPFTSGFKALLNHCERLCDSTKNSVKFIDFKTSLFDSCFLSPFVLGAIEGSKSDEEALKGFPPYKSEWQKFLYPEDPSDLLEMLCEYVRKIYTALTFLKFQCERGRDQAGWQDCYYGKSCQTTGTFSPSNSDCSCPNSKTYLCTKDHSGKCSSPSSGSCSSPCPHPLQRFLCDGSEDSQKFRTPFKPPEGFPKMGFSKENLSSTARDGWSLYHVLKAFCQDGFYPLTRLLQFSLCIFRNPPETLGELFVFFKKLKNPSVFKSQLNTAFVEWISKEPGRPDGQNFTNALKTALETLKGSSHSSSHPNDLRSLSECHAPKAFTCGPYLNPLTGDVYNIFIEDSPGMYLSWICYLPKDFKTLLEEFQGEFLDCCSSGSSSCKFVTCPCILPKLYKYGFTFMKASTLNDKNKKCSDFITQLKAFVTKSTLDKLIAEIEAFLWSIRKPFFLFILAFWAFVISYFLYVQLYKLDILELNSHDHPAWSFKIPPSILFSDSSSKLKDLSYFSL